MNITSVCGQELYRILMGQDIGSLSRLRGDLTDSEKARLESVRNAENSNAKELHGVYTDLYERYQPTVNTSSVTSVLYSMCLAYDSHGARGQFGSSNTLKDLTNHFADIGRRLDAAFAEGKFTEEEYNELNKSLKEYITNETALWDRRRAEDQFMRDRGSAHWQALLSGAIKSTGPNTDIRMRSEEEAKAAIDEIRKAAEVILNKKGFRTDIQKLLETIEQYRKDLSIKITPKIIELAMIDYDNIKIPFDENA